MNCRIIYHYVPDLKHGASAFAPAIPIARCETHNWQSEGLMTDSMCPLGRVDAQIEHALQEIERRLSALENASAPPPQS